MSEFATLLAQLKPKHQAIVTAYLEVGTAPGAAAKVGCSVATVRRVKRRAEELGILEAAAGEVAERGIVNLEGMISQFDADREFAIETKNATAAVRASELKAKMAGFLRDRDPKDAGGAAFQVFIGLPPRGADPAAAMAGEVVEVIEPHAPHGLPTPQRAEPDSPVSVGDVAPLPAPASATAAPERSSEVGIFQNGDDAPIERAEDADLPPDEIGNFIASRLSNA